MVLVKRIGLTVCDILVRLVDARIVFLVFWANVGGHAGNVPNVR